MGNEQQRLSAPGTPAWNPGWYAMTDIYWDPVAGLDTNSGAIGFPVATWAEIIRRYGNEMPIMNVGQNVTIHKLSAQTLNVDPVFFFPRLSNGGYAALIDTLVVFAGPQAAGTVTLLNKAAGTDLTVAGMPAGTTAGMYVFNSTSGSYAFVVSITSGTATMTQPVPTANVTTIGLPTGALGTNWATGDTITVYNKPNLTNLKSWHPFGGDVNGSAACVGWLQWTQIADASGTAAAEYPMVNNCASTVMSGCYIAPRLQVSVLAGRGFGNFVLGCFTNIAIVYSGECEFYGGVIAGTFTNQGVGTTLDGNVIVVGGTSITGAFTIVGSVHFTASIGVQGGVLRVGTTIWGQAGITLFPGSIYENATASTFVLTLLTSGSLLLGSNATGSSFTPGTGLWTSAIALTPANIDANNGLQDPLTGARFCNPS